MARTRPGFINISLSSIPGLGSALPTTPVTPQVETPPESLAVDESEALHITRDDIIPPARDAEIFARAQAAVPGLTREGYEAALAHSVEEINTLHPDMRGAVTIGLRNLYAEGMPVTVNQGHRGKAEQNRAFRQGFSNARYGESFHNYGVAVDVVMINENGDADFRGSPGFSGNPRNREQRRYHQDRLERSIETIRTVFCGDRDINDDGRNDEGRNVGVGLFHLGQGDPAHFQLLPGGGRAAKNFAESIHEESARGRTISVAYTELAEDVAEAIPAAVTRASRILRVERAVARQQREQPVQRLDAAQAAPEDPAPLTKLVADVSNSISDATSKASGFVRSFFA